MSYSFKLTVKDGVVTVDSSTVHVPDGTFLLSGHEDTGSRTISASRIEPSGRTVITANANGWLPLAVEE